MFLSTILKKWRFFGFAFSFFRNVQRKAALLLYFTTYVVFQNQAVMSIWDLGLDTFRRCVLTHQVWLATNTFFPCLLSVQYKIIELPAWANQ